MIQYRVNDYYPTLQGEGVWTGTPMFLLRLQGCSVGCLWCDTAETWAEDGKMKHNRDQIEQVRGTSPLWAQIEATTLAEHCRRESALEWLLLTGGEPAEQPLIPLIENLHTRAFKVSVETSGTATGHLGANIDHITVSPKIDNPGRRPLLKEAISPAHELKFPVGKAKDIEAVHRFLQDFPLARPDVQIFIQPLSQSKKATALCIEEAFKNGWRVSIQVHKYLDLR